MAGDGAFVPFGVCVVRVLVVGTVASSLMQAKTRFRRGDDGGLRTS
jgi:hypothetical protein